MCSACGTLLPARLAPWRQGRWVRHDIRRNGNEGIGKPEPLKHGFQGYWSRHITDEHRLVCKVIDEQIRIAACRYHYER
jgi:Txe/YoeB family toxin of toxin-antitoxin system